MSANDEKKTVTRVRPDGSTYQDDDEPSFDPKRPELGALRKWPKVIGYDDAGLSRIEPKGS